MDIVYETAVSVIEDYKERIDDISECYGYDFKQWRYSKWTADEISSLTERSSTITCRISGPGCARKAPELSSMSGRSRTPSRSIITRTGTVNGWSPTCGSPTGSCSSATMSVIISGR